MDFIPPSAVGSITSRALSRGAACHRQFRKVTLEAGLDVLTWTFKTDL